MLFYAAAFSFLSSFKKKMIKEKLYFSLFLSPCSDDNENQDLPTPHTRARYCTMKRSVFIHETMASPPPPPSTTAAAAAAALPPLPFALPPRILRTKALHSSEIGGSSIEGVSRRKVNERIGGKVEGEGGVAGGVAEEEGGGGGCCCCCCC